MALRRSDKLVERLAAPRVPDYQNWHYFAKPRPRHSLTILTRQRFALMVIALTWAIVPGLSRVFRRWLMPRP